MMELKSKITGKRPIDWTRVIKLSELRIDPKVLQMHKERIDTVFKSMSQEDKSRQLHNIVVRDNLFNAGMDYLIQDYEIEIANEDIENIKAGLQQALGENKPEVLDEIAKKIIKKTLIFRDLQKEFNINISDEELTKILQDYYEQTNQPIRDFMQDEQRFSAAKDTLLEEKTTAFIVDKFPRDLSELEKKLYEGLREAQAKEHKE